ncbi:MAG TPA: NADP-dependent oxidoreductase [Steroidobacteraceae bacterium]|nr:NADP-dependent oxidoreductase [Steroidobacteraceae bacterium]
MTQTYQRIVLASRPQGGPVSPTHFRLEQVPLPTAGPGQILVHNHYLSLDPYMRGRMEDMKSYAAPQPIGETMVGGTVGVVEASQHPGFKPGDAVVGYLGWAEYGLSDGKMLNKVDTTHVPLSAYLGPVGMPGVTAWYGLRKICEPKAGDTVLVSAASGAVGSVVGQLAKLIGCRAIGIAGGPEKCAYVRDELGFDACVDHRQHADLKSMSQALKAAAPDGIDCLFENVGGVGFDAALARMNAFGRVALCGLIAGYEGGDIAMHNVRALLVNRLKLQGFIVSEHPEAWPAALAELGQAVATGRIKYRESIAQGLAAAPEAFIGMLHGKNFGKQLVKLA